jgi:DNA-directed RNA polymerase subunit beta'
METTAGQLAVNSLLPPPLRNYSRRLDKKELESLLSRLGRDFPDQYAKVVQGLLDLGRRTAYLEGTSFSIKDFLPSTAARKVLLDIERQIHQVHKSPQLSEKDKEQAIVQLLQKYQRPLMQAVYEEGVQLGSPLALQVQSGARGNSRFLNSLIGADLLYEDHKDEPLPIPILRNYSQGLTPAQYFAQSFGARKGVIDVKEGVRRAGAFGKKLVQAAHRLVVVPGEPSHALRGLPTTTDDPDNEGALLAQAVGPWPRDTVLTPEILATMKKEGIHHILVRSPLTSSPPTGGVYAKDVGIREHGRLPHPGEFVGINAAQALAEPVAQGGLSSKHSGGIAGAAQTVAGMSALNQLIEVPKNYLGATHAQNDGRVKAIQPAPQGGTYVWVDDKEHYVPPERQLLVKVGQNVEAGQPLSDGWINPSQVVKHRHLGEGRKALVQALRQAFAEAGLSAHRRNLELLARGLINHVRLTHEWGDYLPGDVVPYERIEAHWKPRAGSKRVKPHHALHHYLEGPVLHYTIGTYVRPSVVQELERFQVPEVVVHTKPPPFQPIMVRAMEVLTHDPDWMTRFLGSYLARGFQDSALRGAVADEWGTSYVPALARGVDFGRVGLTAGKVPSK